MSPKRKEVKEQYPNSPYKAKAPFEGEYMKEKNKFKNSVLEEQELKEP